MINTSAWKSVGCMAWVFAKMSISLLLSAP
jgi:hypothetical protein